MSFGHRATSLATLAGLSAAVKRSRWRTERLTILCYHGVSLRDEHEALPGLYVTPATLFRRLRHLSTGGYEVLPLEEALNRLYARSLPPRSVVLTFDDGTIDFGQVVVPMLQTFSFPATLYPTTYYAGNGLPIFDLAARYLLWRGRHGTVDLSDLMPGRGLRQRAILRTAEQREALFDRVLVNVKREEFSATDKNEFLRKLADLVAVDFDELLRSGMFRVLSMNALSALPRDVIDVQLHTHRHRAPRDAGLFSRELDDNIAFLERSGWPCTRRHFCYPSGDYGTAHEQCLSRFSVKSAVTCTPGLASPASNRFMLPRFVDTGYASSLAFEAWLSGAADLLPRRKRHQLDPGRT